jgi:hypothetical protein
MSNRSLQTICFSSASDSSDTPSSASPPAQTTSPDPPPIEPPIELQIDLFSVPVPEPPPHPHPPTVQESPSNGPDKLIRHRLTWTRPGFARKDKFRLLDEYDRLILTAEFLKVKTRKFFAISTGDSLPAGNFYINGRGKQFTLCVPDENHICQREICGFAWMGSSEISVIIHYTEVPYVTHNKKEHLGALAARGSPLEGSLCFSARSAREDGYIEGIPDGIVPSKKNCVIEDDNHRPILVLYKLGDTACSCQSVRIITPLVAFVLAVAIVLGPK